MGPSPSPEGASGGPMAVAPGGVRLGKPALEAQSDVAPKLPREAPDVVAMAAVLRGTSCSLG